LFAQTSSTSSGPVSNHVSVLSVLTSCQSPTQSSAGNHSVVSFFLSTSSNFRLIDYGAIDHRCSCLQYFSSFYSIKIVRVSLPKVHIYFYFEIEVLYRYFYQLMLFNFH